MPRQTFLSCTALAVALACLPAHAAPRAFVSSTGSDANQAAGCSPAAPCRSFQAGHDTVDAGGEVLALDAAGYGSVTVTKSVSFLGDPGFIAGISATSQSFGVQIATAGVNVVLRHLSINGGGSGNSGVRMTAGNSLAIENCVISSFFNLGIYIAAAAEVRIVNSVVRGNLFHGALITGNATVDVAGSRFVGNSQAGFFLDASSSGTTSASVSDSVASGGAHGFVVGGGNGGGLAQVSLIRATAANNQGSGFQVQSVGGGTARMTVGGSLAYGNTTGFANVPIGAGIGIFESLGDNVVRQNTTATTGTITPVSGL